METVDNARVGSGSALRENVLVSLNQHYLMRAHPHALTRFARRPLPCRQARGEWRDICQSAARGGGKAEGRRAKRVKRAGVGPRAQPSNADGQRLARWV